MPPSSQNPRQLALIALRDVYQRGAYTDIALDRVLRQANINSADRGLTCELVYGIVRRQRSLDTLIDGLGKKKATQQPPLLRIILHIGLYQLRYLSQIPAAAAVNTSVELAKENGLKNLRGVVNGLLRQYTRLAATETDPLKLPQDPVKRLGVLHSFPDWIIENWQQELGLEETERLCKWFNQAPNIDLRVNRLRSSIEEVKAALASRGIAVSSIPHLPQALRISGGAGSIQNLPGFREGWWTVQDSSAQLVSHFLAPQPEEIIIDVTAAPGGKTTHIAEIMGDRGTIWAIDRSSKRLERVKENAKRLQLRSIQVCAGDSRSLSRFDRIADRVLLDAPCSGNGTLHRHPDIRWRQTPKKIEELALLQKQLLESSAKMVKSEGTLVYATCTLNSTENEKVIFSFLDRHPNWFIELPTPDSAAAIFTDPQGLIKVWPHRQQMDGFFMVKLKKEL